jgi:hypothetical protein
MPEGKSMLPRLARGFYRRTERESVPTPTDG